MPGEKTAKIIRPVALPRKFIGAPMEPAVMSITLFIVTALGCFISKDYALMGILLIVLMVPVHMGLMWAGFTEPHIGTLMRTTHENYKTARGVGRTKRRYFPAG